MADAPTEVELDRWQVMKELYAKGMRFPDMIPLLHEAKLLECPKGHRKRRGRNGTEVCATCEDTIGHWWRRGLARLSETEAEVLEVRGAWLMDHEFIVQTCRERAIQRVKVTTTRTETVTRTEVRDGTAVAVEVPVAVVTVREEVRINQGLLRLLSETRDKILRMTGIDIDDPESMHAVPRSKVNVRRHGAGSGSGERAVN